ncbi:MAG: hypothetical protein NPINA01_28410 [Nitrospinaceae bacterium]|nr:MAG: hypothetical protein NPINA01_28410 [Nitrospinaceae bacterium]
MQSRENILVITGEELRHQYFANQINAHFPLAAIFTEASHYPAPPAGSEEESGAWDWFFTRRAQYENRVFGTASQLPTVNPPPLIRIQKGKLNSPETAEAIKKCHPGFIAIFGTGMLEDKILALFPERIFNLHVGLPDFYRGSSCNFWPIYEGRLEKLGAAVHSTSRGIDTGKIAAQTTIELDSNDDEQTLMGKTLFAGVKLMISTIHNWRKDTLHLSHLASPGNLYVRKDFTPRAVLRVRKMVESGELKHLIQKTQRDNH